MMIDTIKSRAAVAWRPNEPLSMEGIDKDRRDRGDAADQNAGRASSYQDESPAGTPAGIDVVLYDELDYRLMATFPASDAVAQY